MQFVTRCRTSVRCAATADREYGDFSGNDDEEFSYDDRRTAVHLGTPAYLVTPWGHMKRFFPGLWVPGQKPDGSVMPLGNCECKYWDKNYYRRNGPQLF